VTTSGARPRPDRGRRVNARAVGRWAAIAAASAAATYAGLAAAAWWRYGAARPPLADAADALLDRFMPVFDVAERHRIAVAAPSAITLQAAKEMDLQRSGVTRAIFRAREWALAAAPPERNLPRGLIEQVSALGWGVLADEPGHEIVMGAVTQPWKGDVVFRAVPPDAFLTFDEPDFVKIAWTLRADPTGDDRSVFRTETRAVATDADAAAKFRRYWALASPGIFLIRWLSLGPLKREAERRAIA
jgi:hypothetical protein